MKSTIAFLSSYGPRFADFIDDAVYVALTLTKKIGVFLHTFPFIESAVFISVCASIFIFYFSFFRKNLFTS